MGQELRVKIRSFVVRRRATDQNEHSVRLKNREIKQMERIIISIGTKLSLLTSSQNLTSIVAKKKQSCLRAM